jgi:hypothetical protein
MELREWQYMNPPQVAGTSGQVTSGSSSASTSSTKGGYWERFNRLLFYHVNYKSPAVDKIVRTQVRKDGFHYTEHHRAGLSGYDKDVIVKIDPATESWTLQTYIDGKPHLGGAGDGYTNLLKELRKYLTLPVAGTPEYTKLLTESASIADDFKLYENLWDDDEGKRFKVIMVVDDEEYTYGTYDSRNRANEVAMKVRDERGVDTYIEEV